MGNALHAETSVEWEGREGAMNLTFALQWLADKRKRLQIRSTMGKGSQ